MTALLPALAATALSASAALVAAPGWADTEMVLRSEVSTRHVKAGAGTLVTAGCETGETSLAASFLAEEPDPGAPDGYRKAGGVYAEGWRDAQAGWTYDITNYGTSRDLRLTLTLSCYRGPVEEVRVEN